MADVTFNGMTMEFSVLEFKMDRSLKAKVKDSLEDYSEQALLDAYLAAHKERFGTDFMTF